MPEKGCKGREVSRRREDRAPCRVPRAACRSCSARCREEEHCGSCRERRGGGGGGKESILVSVATTPQGSWPSLGRPLHSLKNAAFTDFVFTLLSQTHPYKAASLSSPLKEIQLKTICLLPPR